MSSLDTRMRASALRLIASYGKSIAYTAISDPVYDPATATAVGTSQGYTLTALVADFGVRGRGGSAIDGTSALVRSFDKSVTIAASGLAFTPAPKDKIVFDTFSLTVIRVITIYSGNLPCIFEIHCSE